MRTLFVAALAATLAGCSSQPPPHAQAAIECGADTNRIECGADTNRYVCLERAAGPPIKLATFRIKSSTTGPKSAGAQKAEKLSSAHARHKAHLAGKAAKSTAIAAKAEPPASRVPLPPSSPKTQLQAGNAGESIAEPDRTVRPTYSNTEAQVAAAIALAERVTAATAPPLPDTKNRDGSSRLQTLVAGNTENPGSASANDKDLLVVVLLARPDMKSVFDLTGKTIAIDDMFPASNGTVRTALVAAGASSVQLSEGQATAINRLVNGEVPAAVLALVSVEAAEGFPEIPGFRTFTFPFRLVP